MPTSPGIVNPAGAFGLPVAQYGGQPAMSNDYQVIEARNVSAITLNYGAPVILGDATGNTCTTTTTSGAANVLGVVGQPWSGTPVGNNCGIVVTGVARVNIGANAVVAGDWLQTSTTAGVATTSGTSGATVNAAGVSFARALEASGAKDSNNCIRAFVFF